MKLRKVIISLTLLGASAAFASDPVVKNADHTKNADNTKINERDREGSTKTPLNQGNSAEDTQITATIRKEMMGDKNLSFAAKNTKVITLDRKVTLRGPVKSADEKSTIEAIARKAQGVSTVENQLEVEK